MLALLGCVALPSEPVRNSITALAKKLLASSAGATIGSSSSARGSSSLSRSGSAVDLGTGGVDEHTSRLLELLLQQLCSVPAAAAAGPGGGGIDCALLPAACVGGNSSEMLRGFVVTTACEAVLPNLVGVSLEGLVMRDRVFDCVLNDRCQQAPVRASCPGIHGQLQNVPSVLNLLVAAIRALGGECLLCLRGACSALLGFDTHYYAMSVYWTHD
eukprot:COSAG05_NODE_126_length_17260_cov_8.550434_8_plen_215_part_00